MSHNRNDPSGQSLELELDPTPQAPSVARAAVNGFASGLDIDSTAVATLQLLVSEIVTNAVIHPSTERGSKSASKRGFQRESFASKSSIAAPALRPTPRDPARIGRRVRTIPPRQASRAVGHRATQRHIRMV